ncbi:MAG TPA: thiopeptide-type bacteriocin biosynthesis protein [Saprospiraceae bacterium]|nr:thiopeptide-type bacteriocin biosynthesis protein [Saprospiraceae bacterium]HNM25036.1 thiopeptide-type bacteriocin biosynthesis protein [Saprospiraceae bacterium]
MHLPPTMPHWLSFHVHPLETPDAFLARGLKPFLEQYIWSTPGARAFFVRQEDERGPQIRIRLYGQAEWARQTLRPAALEWFAARGTVEEAAYVAEPERFGGPEALKLAEEHFHLSTRVVLERLNRPYTHGDALFDTLRLDTITAFAAGMIRLQATRYFGRLCDQWLPLFFRPEGEEVPADYQMVQAIKDSFDQSLDLQKEDIKSALDVLWNALADKKFDNQQPEWQRWLRGNELIFKALGDGLEKALPSLIHLNHNRIGVNNQDEVYLLYVLSQTL